MSLLTREVSNGNLVCPSWFSPWVKMLEGCITSDSVFNSTKLSVEILESLISSGWMPPNVDSKVIADSIDNYKK